MVGVSDGSYASGQTWSGVRYASASAVVPEPGTTLSVLGGLLSLLLLLLLLAQSPCDAASGAAISMRHMACLLAKAGWQVRALSTDLSEAGTGCVTTPRRFPQRPAASTAQALTTLGNGRCACLTRGLSSI